MVALNWLFFGVIFVAFLLGSAGYRTIYVAPLGEGTIFRQADGLSLPSMILYIFLFNSVLAGFVLLTFSGLVFFALPFVFLFVRALLWSSLIPIFPSSVFLAAFPVFILEGEAYVLASVAGVVLGLSWLKSGWVYHGQPLSRLESLRKGTMECVHIYIWVLILLLAGAIVESLALISGV